MLLNFHLPHFFTKKVREEIGQLYYSSSIYNMATSMMLLFEPIFLFSVLKFSVNQTMLFMGLVYAIYIIFIPLGGRFASVYGYKHAIAISIPFQILYWGILAASQQNFGLAYFGAIAYGLSKAFYWPGFHSIMARYADRGQVGREFGLEYALIGITQIFGPFLAGFLWQTFGFGVMFAVASIICCISAIPLLKAKEIFIPKIYYFKETWKLYKAYPKKFLGYIGFGEELLVLTIWPIFIYIALKNYESTGFIATVASLLAAIMALIIGRITDQYTKTVLIKMGAFFGSLVWLARIMVPSTVWSIFALDTMSRTSKEMSFIPISTVTYMRAEATHIVPYAVFFEQSLAIGKLLACILGIILFSLTGSFMVLFILGALFSLLYMFI